MYAVTGITGKVGAAVARSLLSADQPVRAVVRDALKGASWANLGCDIALPILRTRGRWPRPSKGQRESSRCFPRSSIQRPAFQKPEDSLSRFAQLLLRRNRKESWHCPRSAPMRLNRIY
jgi:nucleoside-diphosphate-sugar epimerase